MFLKKLLICAVVFLIIVSSNNLVKAETNETQKEGNVNGVSDGVVISDTERNRLKELGYIDDYINNMTEEQYNATKEEAVLDTQVVTEFIKTTEYFEDENWVNEENPEVIDTEQEILTQAEFNEEVSELKENTQEILEDDSKAAQSIKQKALSNDSVSLFAVADDGGLASSTTGTNSNSNYKKLTITIKKLTSNTFLLTAKMDWKKVPANRLKDIISVAWDSTDDYNYILSSLYGTQVATGVNPWNGKKKVITYTYDRVNEANLWDVNKTGISLVQNLKDDWDVYEVQDIVQTMQVKLEKDTTWNTKWLNAGAVYMHQTKNVSFGVDSFSIGATGGTSGVDGSLEISFKAPEVKKSFDTQFKAYAQLRLKW
ncbi:hypothetical protein ACTNDN_15170 [Niallia sp. HCP3S3_B10]|jgi:phage terminase small subunit|nr:hypothetical protein [Niallia sp. MER TA 168]MCM3363461.1 hypothetical protein [Niallia sp. MER TA 168]